MICPDCAHAARIWKDPDRERICTLQSDYHDDYHQPDGVTIAECERAMRHDIERAGGMGQWLTAVKNDHQELLHQPLAGQELLDYVTRKHSAKCPGLTWCDCQHYVPPK